MKLIIKIDLNTEAFKDNKLESEIKWIIENNLVPGEDRKLFDSNGNLTGFINWTVDDAIKCEACHKNKASCIYIDPDTMTQWQLCKTCNEGGND